MYVQFDYFKSCSGKFVGMKKIIWKFWLLINLHIINGKYLDFDILTIDNVKINGQDLHIFFLSVERIYIQLLLSYFLSLSTIPPLTFCSIQIEWKCDSVLFFNGK
jgi:hypothetical protein